jgi:FkbM family methyltransferase
MLRKTLEDMLRPWLERLGVAALSHPALHGIDLRLAELFPQRAGWFIEAGANDGFAQSNTYYLERFRGWRGLLIEPEPELAAACQRRRPRSRVVQCALGSPELAGQTVELRFAGLMSNIAGSLGDAVQERERAAHGLAIQGLPVEEKAVGVPIRTLTDVLEKAGAPEEIDLLSLDVEGYEVEALKGLDLRRYAPRAICVEVRSEHLPEVRELLGKYYDLKEVLHEGVQHGDYLWVKKGS